MFLVSPENPGSLETFIFSRWEDGEVLKESASTGAGVTLGFAAVESGGMACACAAWGRGSTCWEAGRRLISN